MKINLIPQIKVIRIKASIADKPAYFINIYWIISSNIYFITSSLNNLQIA